MNRVLEIGRSAGRRLGVGRTLNRLVIEPYRALGRRRLPDHNVIREVNGFAMELRKPRSDRLGAAVYVSSVWEPAVTQKVRELVRPGMTALDVGADIGYFTLLLGDLVGPDGKVFAFEPIPMAREVLERNIARNALRNVEVLPLALGERSGSAVLRDPFGLSRISLEGGAASGRDVAVRIEALDDLERIAKAPVGFVKMDIEGAEWVALRGMEATLREHRPILVLEMHGQMLSDFGGEKRVLLDWLDERSYRGERIDGVPPEAAGTTTMVFRPSPR